MNQLSPIVLVVRWNNDTIHLFLAGKLNNMSQIINAIRLSNELILEQLIHTYIISFNTVFLKKINYKINTKSKYILLNNLFI